MMKIYASVIVLVYYHRTLVIQLQYCLSQEIYYFFNFFSIVSISSVVGTSFVSYVFPLDI